MATVDLRVTGGMDDFELPPRKKPKISELPLSSAQRASIHGMLHTFKKKGEFDALRKKVFQQYNESAQRGMFEASLRTFTTNEIDRDPVKYLKPDRRIASQLLEGAAARANTYAKTESDIDAYIDQYLANAERALRDIRRQEIGEEAAQIEQQRGSKSDEMYAAEAKERELQREKDFEEAEKKRKKEEAKERKKKELEALLKKQEELKRETERLQRDQKRRSEREAFKAAEKERERERIRKFNEERERQREEAQERERRLKEEEERVRKERLDLESKKLEEEALNELLREGQRMAERTKRTELERSESMEPPPRLHRQSFTPHNAIARDEMRSVGLMPTSLTLRRGNNSAATASMPAISTERNDPKSHRPPRGRTPSPPRSSTGRTRRDLSPRDDDRRESRREASRRESILRDISAEREAWKAKLREKSDRHGEEGEVMERAPARLRSRSRDSIRRRRSPRSPARRNRGGRSRSRSPPRRYRDRDYSPPKRERSRSPPGIDRYVPGGGVSRRERKDDDRPSRRGRDDAERSSRRARDDDTERNDDRDRRRSGRYDDRPKGGDIDRYVPGSSGRGDQADRSTRRRERSRSRSRGRGRGEREKDRHRARERSADGNADRGRVPPKDKDRERGQSRDS